MDSSQEDIVTLIPRFAITKGEPPIREIQPQQAIRVDVEATPTLLPEDSEDLWALMPQDVSATLLPADIDDPQTTARLPARSMLRRLPSLLD